MDSDVSDVDLKRMFTSLYNNFCSIFGSSSFSDEFINHLKLIDVPAHTPCCNKVVDAWKCETCLVQYSSRICVDCFEKSKAKHQGHKLIFQTEINGCCNCGDPYVISNEGACDDHKNAIEGDEAVQDYLDRCFKPKQQSSIKEILDMIFSLMNSYLGKYQGKDCFRYKTEILDTFLNFIFKISSNTAMMFLVTENLCKTYRNNVKHRCFYIENNKIKMTKEGEGSHLCKCPFIRIIFEHWSNDLKQMHSTFLFLKNLKLKKVYAMSLLSLYKDLYLKKYDTFEGIAFKVFDMKTAGVIANSTEFIEYIFTEFYKVIEENKDFKLDKPRKEISDFMFLFQIIFSNLIYPNTYKKLGENINLFKTVINILELLQYSNTFQKKDSEVPLNDYNWYYEFYMLSLFGMLCACADYSNKKFINEIFDYFSQKIREHYKEVTPLNYNYTIHLTLYRGFSIIVIRYMYSYSVKNNCDLLSSLRLILRNIPKFEKVCEIIIKDELKFIGFLASVKAGEWILIEDIKNYNFDYFTTKVPRLMDQSLMKLMLCLEENAKYFQFHKMLKYATYGDSSTNFIDKIMDVDNKNTIPFRFYQMNEKSYTITAEIIRLVLAIVRNRISIFETFHVVYFKLSKNKTKLDVCEKILEYEKENIIEKTRQRLINRILSFDNSALFSDFENNCYADYLGPILPKDEFKKFVISLTNKTVLLNQEVRYTIKDDFLSQCDIGLIPYIQRATQAENYLLEFKKNKVNILNTFNVPPFDIENDLDLESNVHFFVPNITSKNSNSNFLRLIRIKENVRNNIDFIREFLVSLVEKQKYTDITKIFLHLFAKMLLVFTDITYKNNRFKDVTLDSYVIVNALKPYDDTYKDLISFLKTNIERLYGMATEGQKEATISEDVKSKKKQLLDKYKKKFKKKNEDIKNKFIDKDAHEEKEQIESCVICKNEIDFKDTENISGKLCLALTDSLVWKTRDIKAYKIFKKYNKTPFKYRDYISKFVTKSTVLEKMNTRILTCNHYAHYKCYEKYQKNIKKKDLQCPLCKTMINLFLPDIIHIKEGRKNDLTFAQLERWLGDFAKTEIASEIDDVSEKSLCEYFQSINSIINIRMKESADIESNAEKVYGIIIRNFNSLYVLVHNMEEKEIQKQIENFANLLLTLRSVIIQSKSGSNLRNFLMNYIVMKDQILKEGEFEEVDKIFDSMLIFMMLFTEDAEFDEIVNLQGILAMFLPYYAFNIYLKNLYYENGLARSDKIDAELSVKKIYSFFRNDLTNDTKAEIETTITELLTKLKLAKQISHFVNRTISPINTDYSLHSLLSEFHIDTNRPLPALFISFDFLKEIPSFLSREATFLARTYYDTVLSSLSDSFTASQFTLPPSFLLHSCLPPSIGLISLPSNLIDYLVPFQKRGCHYCKKLDTHFLVCMACGRKLCNSFDCLYKKQEKYSCFYHHAKYCTGLNSLYFIPKGGLMRFCSFNFYSERLIVYKNALGDRVSNDEVTNDFTLDEEEVKKAVKRFILFKHIESSKDINDWEWVEAFFKPREEFEDFDCDDEYEYKDI